MPRSWSSKGPKASYLKRAVRYLRTHYPTPYPVRVRVGKLPHRVVGATSLRGRRLWIFLDPKLAWTDMQEVLIHEWAHAVDWRHQSMERVRDVHHTDEWGLVYARIYRDFYDLELVV